jgi:hypothetical protein
MYYGHTSKYKDTWWKKYKTEVRTTIDDKIKYTVYVKYRWLKDWVMVDEYYNELTWKM